MTAAQYTLPLSSVECLARLLRVRVSGHLTDEPTKVRSSSSQKPIAETLD
jgi:hypothetical protein